MSDLDLGIFHVLRFPNKVSCMSCKKDCENYVLTEFNHHEKVISLAYDGRGIIDEKRDKVDMCLRCRIDHVKTDISSPHQPCIMCLNSLSNFLKIQQQSYEYHAKRIQIMDRYGYYEDLEYDEFGDEYDRDLFTMYRFGFCSVFHPEDSPELEEEAKNAFMELIVSQSINIETTDDITNDTINELGISCKHCNNEICIA